MKVDVNRMIPVHRSDDYMHCNEYKRPIGHIAHLRNISWEKSFFSKAIKLIYCRLVKILLFSPLGKGHSPSFESIPFPQGCCVPSLIEIGPVILEKKTKM